jgi:hypothetical protein
MIAYVVACYMGPRRIINTDYIKDSTTFIKQHCTQLETLKTSLINKIIFVVNSDDPDKLSTSYLNSIVPPVINNIETVLIKRHNTGLSYGAWNHAAYLVDSEYCFFIEDDYIPVIDNFDQIFMNKFTGNIGYVCSLAWANRTVAAITNGLIKTDALKKVGGIPHTQDNSYGPNEQAGHFIFPASLKAHGFDIIDISEEYSVPFLHSQDHLILYGKENGEAVLYPIMKGT